MDRDQIVTSLPGDSHVDVQQQLREHRELIQAVQFLNRSGDAQIMGKHSRFQFKIDSASRLPVVKVIQADTKEVIFQLPTDTVLELAREARKRLRASR